MKVELNKEECQAIVQALNSANINERLNLNQAQLLINIATKLQVVSSMKNEDN